MNRDDTTGELVPVRADAPLPAVPGVVPCFSTGAPAFAVTPLPASRPLVIGRGTDVEVFIDGPTISRHHVLLSYEKDGWIVDDRSRHGCAVDGKRVDARVTLSTPRVLRIEGHLLFFLADSAALSGPHALVGAPLVAGPTMHAIHQTVAQAAQAGADLLLTGETGTGHRGGDEP